MYPKLFFCLFLLVFPVAVVLGQEEAGEGRSPGEVPAAALAEGAGEPDAKMVGGMSILGNKEAPMSLFIVPWKTSELGAETSLTRTLDERGLPVDREVFARELAFYRVKAGDTDSSLAAVNLVLK